MGRRVFAGFGFRLERLCRRIERKVILNAGLTRQKVCVRGYALRLFRQEIRLVSNFSGSNSCLFWPLERTSGFGREQPAQRRDDYHEQHTERRQVFVNRNLHKGIVIERLGAALYCLLGHPVA